jgi:hypothetical protein
MVTIAGGLVAGVAAAVLSIWITRRQSRTLAARFARAEHASWALYLLLAALIYVGFAWSASPTWMHIELAGVVAYGALAWLGYRYDRRLLALGWLLHAAWDSVVHSSATPFVPEWYRWACLAFDIIAALWIARRL